MDNNAPSQRGPSRKRHYTFRKSKAIEILQKLLVLNVDVDEHVLISYVDLLSEPNPVKGIVLDTRFRDDIWIYIYRLQPLTLSCACGSFKRL